MLSFSYIDRPAYIPNQQYAEAIDEIVGSNKNLQGLKAIYQFGNISSPGISDLDLLFVFHNGCQCRANGFERLSEKYKALFTHGIMAVSDNFFTENNYYTIWSNHHKVWGTETEEGSRKRNGEEEKQLKIQTAVEFLIANYIDLHIQKSYKVIKLRAFLQHMKGILYDLEMLDKNTGEIYHLLQQLKHWILNWFDITPADKEINLWIEQFDRVYERFVNESLKEHPMYLPALPRYPIARNMNLKAGDITSCTRKGLLLPVIFSSIGRNYFKLQHRLNTFTFTCPISHEAAPIVKERYDFLKRMKDYNREHLPNFMTITTSITSKLI